MITQFRMLQINYKITPFALVALLNFLLIVSACSPRDRVPPEFPDEEEMAEILAELYITESLVTHGRGNSGSTATDDEIPAYYKGVLDEYDLTTEKFDTIRKWYATHPYHYQEVYDRTIVLLSKREAELNKQIKEAESQQDSIPEIIDLWVDDRKFAVTPEDTTDRRLPFQLHLDSISRGGIMLSAFYKFLREDLSGTAHMTFVTMYADSTADTLTHALEKTFQEKSVALIQSLDSINPAIEVSGFLFEHDTTSVTAVEFSKIRLYHLFNNERPDSLIFDAIAGDSTVIMDVEDRKVILP